MSALKFFSLKIDFNEKFNLIRLIAGGVIFAAGFVLEKTMHESDLTLGVLVAAYVILGSDIVFRALKNLVKGKFFDENFLMSIATIGAFLIGEYSEAVVVMLFYQVGEYFQDRAVQRSKKSITDLMDIRPDYANVIKNGETVKVSPETVAIGETIIVKPGEKIPLDGIVIEGSSMIDTSALTGESVPRTANVKTLVLSGCVNINGKLTVEVIKSFGDSTVSKIINLVENSAGKKAQTEKFITKFARVYTPIVVILAALLAILPPLLLKENWNVWIHRALVFLVISCPCALVLSIPMGFFAGIGRAAKSGILVKGGNYLEAFNKLETVVFDKTGTLTRGVFKVTDIITANGCGRDELIEMAANAEKFSNHPIAVSINEQLKINSEQLKVSSENILISDYTEVAGCGVSVVVNGKVILAGNEKLMKSNNVDYTECVSYGTKVYIACENIFMGCIVISDEIKPDSKSAITALRDRGVRRAVMLTGDDPRIAKEIADELGIDEFYGGLLPQDKVRIVEKLNTELAAKLPAQPAMNCVLSNANISAPKSAFGKNAKKRLAFVGDGINDAPVLALADIGIAMGAFGSDAAIEAADVVLMTDEPSKLAQVIDISRFTGKIAAQNIIFVLLVKVVFLTFGAFGIASMWEAVFADVGVSLLAVLNSMRILKCK